MEDRCFICGGRVGRGNQPSVGVHERMSKLVSVNKTVEHSSTIISDILSRILNETVMKEETICRICFNLLNDIDYHLKEAQEKTDEITNKFLDKGKDPLSYRPQPIVSAAATNAAEERQSSSKEKRSRSSNSGTKTSKQTRLQQQQQQQQPPTGKAGRKRRQAEAESAPPPPHGVDYDTDGAPMTEDEMSVNVINRNKQKLLSHVLNPRLGKKEKVYDYAQEDDETEKEEDEEDDDEEEEDEDEEEDEENEEEDEDEEEEEYYEPKWKKRKGKENRREKRKRRRHNQAQEETELSVSRYGDSANKSGEEISGTAEFVTVNMDDLGDILSKPKPVYYAKKSDPTLTARERKQQQEAAAAEGESGLLQCEQCKKQFKKRCNLQLHIEKVHQSDVNAVYVVDEQSLPETHKCSICPREFTNSQSLEAHKQEHKLGVLEKKPVMTNVKVSKPTKPAEGNEVKATCPQCHKTFRRLFNMKIHVDRVHKKVKPFPCTKCTKSFATNSDLRQHMTVHGEGKAFECEECGRTFSNRDSIILHRKQHTNERTHFCNICDKGFFKASCLSRHMRTHTGERPYTCDQCGKGFSQCTTLKTHKAKCGSGGAGGSSQSRGQQQAIGV